MSRSASRSAAETRLATGSRAPRVLTVSEVNAAARGAIEARLGMVWVEGEVSNYKAYSSGHWYFSLKDDRAQMRCVMFAGRNRLVRHEVRDGTTVRVRGRLSIYEPRGQFQAVVDHLEPAGEGAIRAALERRTKRLAAEGLFAAERKRSLPSFPRHVGIISSGAGAAPHDVLAVIRRRFPCLRVTWFHVAVQGADAPRQILAAFDQAECLAAPPDVLILTRGGGSLEDLEAFNDEAVARRIAAARIVVVSAVGHETDFTLADMAADRRASTPSAAAEMATPDGAELLLRLSGLQRSLAERLAARIREEQRVLAATRRRLVHPGRTLEERMQRVDETQRRLATALRADLRGRRSALAHGLETLQRVGPAGRLPVVVERVDAMLRRFATSLRTDTQQRQASLVHLRGTLRRVAPGAGLPVASERVARADERLRGAMRTTRERAAARLAALMRALKAVSPLATLARGYGIVARPDGSEWGKPVLSVGDVEPGDRIIAHVADGMLAATVDGREKAPGTRAARIDRTDIDDKGTRE